VSSGQAIGPLHARDYLEAAKWNRLSTDTLRQHMVAVHAVRPPPVFLSFAIWSNPPVYFFYFKIAQLGLKAGPPHSHAANGKS